MRLLIVNLDSVGEGLPLAIRAAKAGHEVKIWYSKDNHETTGEGFKGVERVKNWLAHAKWANLIVPTGNHEFIDKFDHLRREGLRVFGPSKKSAALEIDRARGMQFFKTAGVAIPTSHEFASL